MKLKWYGHSCFALAFSCGTTIVIDPFDDSVGYPLCRARADAVLCSHDHFDHNHVSSLQGKPLIVADRAPRTVGGVQIHGLPCFHDDAQGAKRGKNIAFILEGDGLRIAHLGDLGHMPTPEMYEALRSVDVMLVPIGGTYTITGVHSAYDEQGMPVEGAGFAPGHTYKIVLDDDRLTFAGQAESVREYDFTVIRQEDMNLELADGMVYIPAGEIDDIVINGQHVDELDVALVSVGEDGIVQDASEDTEGEFTYTGDQELNVGDMVAV